MSIQIILFHYRFCYYENVCTIESFSI